MKKLYLYLLLLLCSTGVSGQGNITLSTAQDKGGTQVACQSITLKPGFSFVSAAGKSLTLSVNPTTCDPYAGQASSVSSNQNYIQTRTYTVEDGSRYLDQIQYFDGLGRPVQTVQRGVTPNTADLVTYQEYDAFGRESNAWLPAVIPGNNGAFVNPATVKTGAISSNGNDQKPYSLPVYEASPLNRVLKQFGPGQEWHNADNGNGKAVSTAYKTNVSGDAALNCKLYIAGDTNQSPSLTQSGNYATGELYVTEVKDEDGNTSFEFKDKLGQVVLTRQIDDGQNYDTYYVYNVFGNQCFVLPPKIQDEGVSQAKLDELAFQYRYDNRNRCIGKKIPGTEWIYYVYDKADRLIFSQDGEQRDKTAKEWTFNKYDAFGRLIISGIYKTNSSHEAMQSTYSVMVFKETPGAGNYGYSWNILPNIPVNDVLLINYYDDYEMMLEINPYFKVNLDYNAEAGYGTRHSSAKGLLVGTRVKLIGSDGKSVNTIEGQIVTAMYYDNRGRLIQTKSNNHLTGGIEKEYITYNFTGQPTKRKHVHSATGKNTQTEAYTYTYDHAGRLLKTTHQLNSGAVVTLAENTYDELGRLKANKKNNQANLNTTYAYNIRSWTNGITNAHFNERLAYTYNGNISSMQWGQAGKTRKYDFTYDNLSRLKTAAYTGDGNFNTAYSYDKHGNMMTLQRYGLTAASSYGIIDNLTMAYTGNQLLAVDDAAANIALAESMDFKNGSNVAVEYTYNTNGAMTKDLNKGITEIQYNSLNLPRMMDIKSPVAEARNEYTYSASGQKLKVVQKWNPDYSTTPVIGSAINTSSLTMTKTTDYVGNIIYENGNLKRILVDGGYIEGGVYHYYLNDHLGNNRVVANSSGTVIQSNQYYPFGMSFADTPMAEQGKQPYKYNNKELDMMHGLNMYDYSARHLALDIPKFTTVDPLAEKYYSWSPYVYTFNNPLRFTDPTGEEPQDGIDELLKALKQVGNEILNAVGLSSNQVQSEDPTVLEDASQKRIEAAENIETANDVLTTITPVGGAAAVLSNADQGNYLGALAAVPFAVLDLGTGGKSSGVVKGANAVEKGVKIIDKAGDAAKVVEKTTGVSKGVIAVTKEGVALPKGYKIPNNLVGNAKRSGSYGVMENGKFVEKLRIDPATPAGAKGPNFSHFHLNNKGKHYTDPNKLPK